jgi:hypothetical protein
MPIIRKYTATNDPQALNRPGEERRRESRQQKGQAGQRVGGANGAGVHDASSRAQHPRGNQTEQPHPRHTLAVNEIAGF